MKLGWMRRIEDCIARAIGKLTSFSSGSAKPIVGGCVRKVLPSEKSFVISPEFARKLMGRIDDLKQQWGKRIW